jgi:hypothetical protein
MALDSGWAMQTFRNLDAACPPPNNQIALSALDRQQYTATRPLSSLAQKNKGSNSFL